MTKKNLLVTGGAGFIGSTFVAQAVERGDNVIVLDALTYAGNKLNLAGIEGDGSCELVVGDICNGSLVSELLTKHEIDAIVHFAAESHVDNSIVSSAEFMQTNIIGTYTLLETSRKYWNELDGDKQDQFRFIQVSTDEVYGTLELGSSEKFTEETKIMPTSPYSASKAAGDHLAHAWFATYDFPVITTNCSNNYGHRQYPEKLIPTMITRALNGKSLPVYGDGKNVRDWIHVEDHCHGVYLALTKGKIGETYCFGGNAERNNNEVVSIICSILEELVPSQGIEYKELIKYVVDRLGHDRRYAIDDNKAVKELGFTRKYDFEDGIKATVEWYLNNTDWCDKVTDQAA